ncbi:aldo/keto reductase [Lederbergia sp. NSJ-179]|uniref:aldo/keto reductase n=1 Tax=Lederbergia sp. NSJ-179 TaxID=2931402 RepID=UPI0028BD863B|nr:aldo/keto reductase [Lederbergia sp. NSJ-179]
MELALGTVQLGMKYGIQGNEQPDVEHALNILNEAYASGIRTLDTSSVYGTAEDVLNQFLHQPHINKDRVHVITKFNGNVENIEQAIYSSLSRLGIRSLDGYLLHDADQVFNLHAINSLAELKKNN